MIDPDDLATAGWAQASLRIASDRMSADAISEALGLRPTSTRTSEGEPSFAVWVFESGLDPTAPIEDHLYLLMERLRERHDQLTLVADAANVEIWLSFSPAGTSGRSAVFDHRVLGELGALGVDLVLDPYPAGRARRAPLRWDPAR